MPQCSTSSKAGLVAPVSPRTNRGHSGGHTSEQNSTAVSAHTNKSGPVFTSPCVCTYSCVWCENCQELDLGTWSAQECWLQILAVPDAGTWCCNPCPAAGTDSFAQTNTHTPPSCGTLIPPELRHTVHPVDGSLPLLLHSKTQRNGSQSTPGS